MIFEARWLMFFKPFDDKSLYYGSLYWLEMNQIFM